MKKNNILQIKTIGRLKTALVKKKLFKLSTNRIISLKKTSRYLKYLTRT